MTHSSDVSGHSSPRLKSVRPDGTPVYRFERTVDRPPVAMFRHDGATELRLPHGQPHAHDFWVLVYVEDGDSRFRVDGADGTLGPGDVYAIAPGQVVGSRSVAALDRCRAWSLSFSPDAVPTLAATSPLGWARHPLLALFVPGAGRARVPVADRPRWTGWFTDLAEQLAAPELPGSAEAAGALLARILVASARLSPVQPPVPDPLVERVYDEIEATFREPVSAAEVARSLGYTPGHLTTVMRQRTGRTLLDWITERRLTEVRRLLRETDLPLDAVASRTGLRTASYLVRRFKSHHGTTPQRWRRANRAVAATP